VIVLDDLSYIVCIFIGGVCEKSPFASSLLFAFHRLRVLSTPQSLRVVTRA